MRWRMFLGVVAGCGVVAVTLYASPLKEWVNRRLLHELIDMDMDFHGRSEVAYVLGAGDHRTRKHLKQAALLHSQGRVGRILFYHRGGSVRYDRSLKQHIPRDRWVTGQLVKYGVPASAVEAVVVPDDNFGTFSEARAVSKLVVDGGVGQLLLVTSPYHTRRVRECFEYFLAGKGVLVVVSGSSDRAYIRAHLIEFFKLVVYRTFLFRMVNSNVA